MAELPHLARPHAETEAPFCPRGLPDGAFPIRLLLSGYGLSVGLGLLAFGLGAGILISSAAFVAASLVVVPILALTPGIQDFFVTRTAASDPRRLAHEYACWADDLEQERLTTMRIEAALAQRLAE